jgi:hypothetical protein
MVRIRIWFLIDSVPHFVLASTHISDNFFPQKAEKQRCGSVTFWYGSEWGSGFSDPYLCLKRPDADPGGPKTYGSGTLVRNHKKSQNSRNKSFSYYCWWWKDPDPYLWITDPDADPGGPKTWILRIGSGSIKLPCRFMFCTSFIDCSNLGLGGLFVNFQAAFC